MQSKKIPDRNRASRSFALMKQCLIHEGNSFSTPGKEKERLAKGAEDGKEMECTAGEDEEVPDSVAERKSAPGIENNPNAV